MPRQPLGQHPGQGRAQRLSPGRRLGLLQMPRHVQTGRHVQPHCLPLAPIVRYLQYRRARQPTVGEQHRLIKGGPPATDPPRQRHSGQGHHPCQFLLGKGQGHKSRPGLDEGHPEALRHPVAKPRGPHLRDRLASACHHQRPRPNHAPRRADLEPRRAAPDLAHLAAQPQRNPRRSHVGQQHLHHLTGRPVAKELPQRLFVPRNPRPVDPRHKVPLAVALQRRHRETRVA